MREKPQSVIASANADEPGGTLRQNRHIGRASGSAVFERPNALLELRMLARAQPTTND
jgi:hypothetical protein